MATSLSFLTFLNACFAQKIEAVYRNIGIPQATIRKYNRLKTLEYYFKRFVYEKKFSENILLSPGSSGLYNPEFMSGLVAEFDRREVFDSFQGIPIRTYNLLPGTMKVLVFYIPPGGDEDDEIYAIIDLEQAIDIDLYTDSDPFIDFDFFKYERNHDPSIYKSLEQQSKSSEFFLGEESDFKIFSSLSNPFNHTLVFRFSPETLEDDMQRLKRFSRFYIEFTNTVPSFDETVEIDPSSGNNLAIRNAVRDGDFDEVAKLLRDPRVNPSDVNNQAITYASLNGRSDIAELLLADTRVDPTVSDNFPLYSALKNRHFGIANLLLDDNRVSVNRRIFVTAINVFSTTNEDSVNMIKRLSLHPTINTDIVQDGVLEGIRRKNYALVFILLLSQNSIFIEDTYNIVLNELMELEYDSIGDDRIGSVVAGRQAFLMNMKSLAEDDEYRLRLVEQEYGSQFEVDFLFGDFEDEDEDVFNEDEDEDDFIDDGNYIFDEDNSVGSSSAIASASASGSRIKNLFDINFLKLVRLATPAQSVNSDTDGKRLLNLIKRRYMSWLSIWNSAEAKGSSNAFNFTLESEGGSVSIQPSEGELQIYIENTFPDALTPSVYGSIPDGFEWMSGLDDRLRDASSTTPDLSGNTRTQLSYPAGLREMDFVVIRIPLKGDNDHVAEGIVEMTFEEEQEMYPSFE
mgnify:CR=1 FL=1